MLRHTSYQAVINNFNLPLKKGLNLLEIVMEFLKSVKLIRTTMPVNFYGLLLVCPFLIFSLMYFAGKHLSPEVPFINEYSLLLFFFLAWINISFLCKLHFKRIGKDIAASIMNKSVDVLVIALLLYFIIFNQG